MGLKNQKQQEEVRRDTLHTKSCQDIFYKEVRDQKVKEIQKRELQKKIAEDNMMIAENKKKQAMEKQVREKIQIQQAITGMKVTAPAMVRWDAPVSFE